MTLKERTIKRTKNYKITKRSVNRLNGESQVFYAVYDKDGNIEERFISRRSDADKIAKELS